MVQKADRMTLMGVRLTPRIGITPAERLEPQQCKADITIWGDLEVAAATDALERTIDYSRVLETAVEVALSREYNLLEALAYRIARGILQAFPASKVGVRLRKRPAALAEKVDFVEIEVSEP